MSEESKSRVLVVDDEMLNLHVLYNTLKEEYTVFTANSGEKALEKARDEKVDLILLDVVMPGMDGFDVLVKLKESNDTRNIPVIFITGLASAKDETKGLFLGAVDYIVKPFNTDIVRARVKTHLKILKQMRLIESLGMIDSLTDLANRRRFDQQIRIEWARATRERTYISLLMMDVDNFKSYNDTYGHPVGDALLQTLGRTFKEKAKRTTDLVARIGGEEFAVVLPGADLEGAVLVGENIRLAVEGLGVPSGFDPEKPVTISIGAAAIIPDKDNRIEDFIKSCDELLYTAKKTGRNKLCY